MKHHTLPKKAISLFLSACLLLSCMPLTTAAAPADTAQTQISNLTTEYLTAPIGLETDPIRFGWNMESNRIGARQEAYQVQVTSNGHSIWDSGKVESSKSTGIRCEGKLEEGTEYQWTVTVWDETGASYSKSANFETGVTNQKAWKDAAFIRLNASPAAPIFRTEQPLLAGKEIAKARLYITALGAYEAYVNGNRIGEYTEGNKLVYHHMNPGYGNGDVSLGYQTYDVTSFLAGSETAAISAILGTGWKNGMGSTTSQPALKALLTVTYGDGSVQQIATDTDSWKGTLKGGITSNGVYYGEDYNAIFAEDLGDFTQAGYDDSDWVNSAGSSDGAAAMATFVENRFQPQEASYVRILVKETGPADNNKENLLQIMELELFDEEGNNVAAGIAPEISNTWSPNGQWKPEHLTDGDIGTDSDNGYTSQVLGREQEAFTLESPVSITLPLKKSVSVSGMRIYPRTKVASISGQQCANYPRKYCLQASQDGQNWVTIDLNGRLGASEATSLSSWTDDTEQRAYTVESLRNRYLYPEVRAFCFGTNLPQTASAKHVRITVSAVGPAIAEDHENRLQIMELELLDGEVNRAANVVPTVSDNTLSGIEQWSAKNLTDGDYGLSDRGYSTDILGKDAPFLELSQPVTIQLDFADAVTFQALKFYPRITKDSISYGICANYPKAYTVEISEDGREWETVLANHDQGLVRNETLYQNTQMGQAAYPGKIRAQNAIPGRLIAAYDQYPVSAYTYSGTKASSGYPGGEVEIDSSYEAAPGQNIFGEGLELKKGQTLIVNMGQNLSAVPQITFSGKQGTRALLNFAEMLNDGSATGNGATQADGPKGSIYQKSLRKARSAASYIFSGNGRETYQTKMSFFGYQYVQVTASDDITIYSLCSKAISSVSRQTGSIRTNNENVNRLFSNVIYGQLSNYFTTPTDCNQRDERLSWSGDTQAFAQTAVYNFDSTAFLNEIQDIYKENTLIKGYVPSVVDQINGYFQNWAAGWSDVLVILPWVLYQQTGDAAALTGSWDALVRYMDYMHSHERGADQAPASGNQNYGDWLSFQGTSVEVINDYYYGYMHQLMAKMAAIIGDTQREKEYSQKFEAIKQKFLATHVEFRNGNLTIKSKEGNVGLQFMNWTDKKGVWENNSQTSLIWMLKLGFYDSEKMRQAAERLLLENIKNENPDPGSIRAKYGQNTLAVGFLGSNVITPVLSEMGHTDVSYDLLLQEGQPSWLFEVLAGATTMWERWNSYTPGVGFGDSEMNSFNHYAYGSVVEWMYGYMAGIQADIENPGFQNIILQPTPDTGEAYNGQERIRSVEGSYDSYYGPIQVAWKGDGKNITSYHAQIPANTTATLYLPLEEGSLQAAGQAGTIEAAASKENAFPAGVTYQGMENHNGLQCAKFTLASGGYDFKASNGALEVSYSEGYQSGGNSGDDKPIAVTGLSVAPTEKELKANETLKLEVTVFPANAANKEVAYHSADEGIASVDSQGIVTAKKAGTTAITAASKENPDITATCTITVRTNETPGDKDVKVSAISLAAGKSSLFTKETTVVKATVSPADATQKGVSWKSSDKSVASVDSKGKVTAKKAGSAKITATATDGSKVTGTCTITVVKPAVKLNAKKAKLQVKKSTAALKATGLKKGDKIKGWRSGNPKIATVSKNGKVTAKKAGTVKITVYTAKGASASCTFQIIKGKVKTSKLAANAKKLTLKRGQKHQLAITRTPITATEKIFYTSSNKKVASVNGSGKITAKKKGKATITAKTSNGKKAKVAVTVK